MHDHDFEDAQSKFFGNIAGAASSLNGMALYYRIAADFVVIMHMTYVLVVVLGLPVTWVGILLRQQWPRNFWWRLVHLTMILIVVFEAMMGITCPLTVWEYELRELAGQQSYQGAFIANLVHDWLFYDAPHWVLTVIYAVFGLLVLTSFIAAPPRWPFSRTAAAVES